MKYILIPNNEKLEKLITDLGSLAEEQITIQPSKVVVIENERVASAILEIVVLSGVPFNLLDNKDAPTKPAKAKTVLPSIEPRECENCGSPFQPKRVDQKFCSIQCRAASTKERARLQSEAAAGLSLEA